MHFVTSAILVLFATLIGSAVAAPVHHKFVRSDDNDGVTNTLSEETVASNILKPAAGSNPVGEVDKLEDIIKEGQEQSEYYGHEFAEGVKTAGNTLEKTLVGGVHELEKGGERMPDEFREGLEWLAKWLGGKVDADPSVISGEGSAAVDVA